MGSAISLSSPRFLIVGGHWNSSSSGTDWTGRGIGMVRLGRTGISHKARHGSELVDKPAASFQEWGTCFSYIRNRGGHVAAGDLRCSESVGPGPSTIITAIRSNLLANRGLGRGFGMREPLGDVIRPPCSHLTDCAIGNGESGVGTYIHHAWCYAPPSRRCTIDTASAPARNSVVAVPLIVITGGFPASTSRHHLQSRSRASAPHSEYGEPGPCNCGEPRSQQRPANRWAFACQCQPLSCHFVNVAASTLSLPTSIDCATATLRERGRGSFLQPFEGKQKKQGPKFKGQTESVRASAGALFHGAAPSDLYTS